MVILKIIDHENNIEKEYDIHSYRKKESYIIIKEWYDNEEDKDIEIKIILNKNDTIEHIPETIILTRGE